jgi:L-histidine Nalpha-methyltransferase
MLVNVWIHPSQFPEQVMRELLDSLRRRAVNHKFHYDSVKQAQKWIALHDAYSPARTDPECVRIYEAISEAAAADCADATSIDVIGIGCGSGEKDAVLLSLLRREGRRLSYLPCDVGTAMVLTATRRAAEICADVSCVPFVCDLATTADLPAVLDRLGSAEAKRVITFFGMIPNFEPDFILSRLAEAVRKEDLLLFSANLAPGADYTVGTERVLGLYDNELTRDWLMTFLVDLGVELHDGQLAFVIEEFPDGSGLKRIAAYFNFEQERTVRIGSDSIVIRRGESVRLFFSYRYTPAMMRSLLGAHGIQISKQGITASQEEGVFLCRKG